MARVLDLDYEYIGNGCCFWHLTRTVGKPLNKAAGQKYLYQINRVDKILIYYGGCIFLERIFNDLGEY